MIVVIKSTFQIFIITMQLKFHQGLFFVIILVLHSCKSPEGNQAEITIGFSQCIDQDIWRKSMDHTMEVEASLHPNVQLTILNANRQAKKQISDIEKFIKDKVDVIIISPFESDSIVPVIEKAFALNIPVIIIDRKVNTTNYSAYLGADNVEVGRIVGRHIVSLSKGITNVIEIKGASYTSPGLERSMGFSQIVNQYPNIKVISIDAQNDELPKDLFIQSLKNSPEINYVYAYNDVIAYQAWKAAKWGKAKNKIKFIGVDGVNGPNGGIQLVKDGVLASTVLYPTGGSEAIKLALKIANNEIVPKNNKLNTILIDSVNADIMSNQFDRITIQQFDIEQQQKVIKNQEKEYSTQTNLLRLLFSLFMLALILAVFSIYSRITIGRKNKELEQTNIKIKSQRNEMLCSTHKCNKLII